MLSLRSLSLLACALPLALAEGLSSSNLKTYVDSLTLDSAFSPIKEAYWTGYAHHRRTPFAVSPDGKSAYLAYLDGSETDVHVQKVNPSTFAADGSAVTVSGGKEAGGLVAHNDGFALLTNEAMPSGTQNAPPDNTPVPVLYRYTNGKQTWKTWLGGPEAPGLDGKSLAASPDINGDLVYSSKAGLYGAYFVVTDYQGDATGHFGDSVQYVSTDGTLKTIEGATSSWGCSHNTGIAIEEADNTPFATICAEDQGAIWLNTKGQGMSTIGVKISNENTTNGGSGEPMGGMSGSYSGLTKLAGGSKYVFAWVSRGATDLHPNEWMNGNGGSTYVSSSNRTDNRRVAIASFSDKNTLVGEQASSTVGDDGDSQVNWITQGGADCSNAHVAAFDDESVLITWEEIADPICEFIAMGCRGEFTGSYYQLVTGGKKVGTAVKSMNTYVAGDMVTMLDGRVCWPYVDMDWDLSQTVSQSEPSSVTYKKMSFACMTLAGGNSSSTDTGTASSSSSTSTVSSAAAAGTGKSKC